MSATLQRLCPWALEEGLVEVNQPIMQPYHIKANTDRLLTALAIALEAIEKGPHIYYCDEDGAPCVCWKAEALKAIKDLKKGE